MSRRSRFEWSVLGSYRQRTKRERSGGLVSFGRRLRLEPLEERRMLAVFTVTNVNDAVVNSAGAAPGTLRQAIFDANSAAGADTINFAPSLTAGGPTTIVLSHDELKITGSLTITGPGANLLKIDASGNDVDTGVFGNGSRVFDVNDNVGGNLLNVTISGLRLTGADKYEEGGAIRSLENLKLIESLITGNQSGRGGGLYNGSGTMEIIRSTISHNNDHGPAEGHLGSGITNWLGTLVVTDSTISDNGLILCPICGVFKGGAGIVNHRGSATITGSTITGNSGGGIYSSGLDAAADVTITNSTISGNLRGFLGGNGLSLNGTVSNIQNCIINDNESRGIYSRFGNLTIDGSTISGNAGPEGSGIRNISADLTISETTISGNTATGAGGGVYHGYGKLSITSSTISGNSAGTEGGGLRLLGRPSSSETMLISNSTISGNTSSYNGGGIWARTFPGNSFDLAHSTVTGNTADADSIFGGEGGGMFFFYSTGTDTIDHTIVAGNVRGNGGRDDIDGNVQASYSLVGDNTGATITDNGGNLIGSGGVPIDPRLAPLADNGGPTMTHRLQIGSPAIDAGDEDAVANVGGVPEFDQRGNPFTRVFDGDGNSVARIDIGAFESNTVASIVDTTDDENDGDYSEGHFSLREAIELSNASAVVETIGFDSSLNGQTITLSMGDLDITAAVIIETSGLDDGLTIDAVGNDFHPGIIDGFGSRVFTVDNGNSGISIDVTISGLTLRGADEPNGGGAIYNDEHLTLISSVLTGNAAQWGAGIYNGQFGDLTVIGSTISGNIGTGSGAGVYNWGGTASIIQSTISQNVAPDGGGIRNVNDGFLALKQSTVSDNSANGHGGGILNDGDTVTIEDSTISGNHAIRGAGLYNASGNINIVRSTISGNEASDSGGGIANANGNLTVSGSTVSGNSANYGGGLYAAGSIAFDTTITNSTISSNTATLAGGGMYNFQGNVLVAHSTITHNEAPANQGSGVFTWADPLTARTTVYSSIVAGNVHSDVDEDPLGISSFVSSGYNLVGTGFAVDSFAEDGDQTGELDPGLGPLQDNGGPTFTHALLAGSPAIDMGDPDFVPPPAFDQRGAGFERVRDGDGASGAKIDIGAFELQQPIGPELPGDYNLDHAVGAVDYVLWRKTLGTTGVPAYSGADGDGDTTIDQDDYGVWRAHFGQTVPSSGSGAVNEFAPVSIRQAVVQATSETVSLTAERDTAVARAASFAELETRSLGHDSSSRSRTSIHRYQVAESGGDNLPLLLAIDRVGRSPRQESFLNDVSGNGDHCANDVVSESTIDEPLAVALSPRRGAFGSRLA